MVNSFKVDVDEPMDVISSVRKIVISESLLLLILNLVSSANREDYDLVGVFHRNKHV